METIQDVEHLQEIYGSPREASVAKVVQSLTPDYQKYVEASPFCVLATCGQRGMDCSPRGDKKGFVQVRDPKTICLPDRLGNNRVDSLQNIVENPNVGLLFFVPGSCTTLRINGSAQIHIDPKLLQEFSIENKPPRSVLVVTINEVFFQCSRALLRAELWNPDQFVDPNQLPSVGTMLANLSEGTLGGDVYDQEWNDRARKSMW